jgi:hypothetical protein
MAQLLYSLLPGIIIAPLAAWLGAQFALKRFYSEKVWERKVAAYTSIFDALHDMCRWWSEHLRAGSGSNIPQDVRDKLSAEYREADAKLARQLDRERWLLPTTCSERLVRMRRDLDRANEAESWEEHLLIGSAATDSTMEDMLTLARNDLKIDRPNFFKMVCMKIAKKRDVIKLI